MDTKIIIQARSGSTRLPRKMLLPFFRGKTILQLIIERLINRFPPSDIILAIPDSQQDDCLVENTASYKINLFRGSEHNVLKRFTDAARHYGCNGIIRVCADNPFLLPQYIHTLIEQKLPTDDYLSFAFPDSTPTILSHIGLFAEYTTLDALNKIERLTDQTVYFEHVTNFLYTHPQQFRVRFLPLPENLASRTDIRLTIDTHEDFELLKEFYPLVNLNAPDAVNRLLQAIDNNPKIKKQMLIGIDKNGKK